MLTTTLNEIRKHSPCENGWKKLLAHLGKTKADDEQISFHTILESNGLDDALWCLRALPESMDNQARLLNCLIAETALKYVPESELRPKQAIDVARKYANGEATQEELTAARDAAWDATWAAARVAARDAARAAAWAAARDAARAAAWAAARDAAWDAAWAAAWAAARDAARDAAEQQHKQIFIDWLKQFDEGANV